MTDEAREAFLADRLRALAPVVLTRRHDLVVRETRQGTGLDLHVFIERDDKPMRRTFGVRLRGAPASLTAAQAGAALGPAVGQFRGLRKFTYPVCLLFFTMREEQAFFTWLAEPVLTAAGPKLMHHEAARCVPMTGAALDEVVGRVVAWYDAVAGVLIA